jgi:ferredoxin
LKQRFLPEIIVAILPIYDRMGLYLRYGGASFMAYVISDECISCGACAAECPVNAISEGDGKFEIDPDVCTECGTCASVCPVGAPKEG